MCDQWCDATCDVMQCHGRSVKCGDAMWNMVVCCDARCEMWLWNTEWCGMAWRHIRHGGVHDAEWQLKCSVGRVVWRLGMCGIVWCAIYISANVVMCMAWCEVQCASNGAPRCGGVSDVNYGSMRNVVWCQCMWNVVRCGMLQFQTWCNWNAKCVMWNMAWCGMWCPGMRNVA